MADLLKVRSFGKTSLREVKRKLADLGLSLGMDLDAAPQAAATMPDDDDEEEEAEDAGNQPQTSAATDTSTSEVRAGEHRRANDIGSE